MTARNHHFVPQCYLRAFAKHDRKPRVFVADLKERAAFQTAPRNIAARRDFNAIDVPGYAPDALEKALAPFEADVASALRRTIESGAPPTGEDRLLILNLAALLAVKNPRQRAAFTDFLGDVYTGMAEAMTSSDAVWQSTLRARGIDPPAAVTRERVRDVLRGGLRADVPTGYHLMMEHEIHNSVLQTMVRRHWTLLRAPKDSHGFITTDHPVCLFWTNPADDHRLMPPGHGMPDTEVLFPLSNGLAWVGTFDGAHPAVVDSTHEHVAIFNGAVLRSAQRQAYGRDGDCAYRISPAGRPRRLREAINDRMLARPADRQRR